MNTCRNCGVELDVEMNFCPLCGQKSFDAETLIQNHSKEEKENEPVQSPYNLSELTFFQRRKLFWELSGIILFSGVLISLIIDLIINKRISWSKYTITIGIFLISNVWLLVFLQNRMVILLSGCFATTSLFILMLDLLSNNMGWGLKFGVPVIFCFFVILFFLVLLIRKTRQKGINLIAYFLTAAGILCLCIESILTLYLAGHLRLHWSIILFISVISVSGILLYIHYRLKKVTDLKRFFHI
jgi:hypothetical protein